MAWENPGESIKAAMVSRQRHDNPGQTGTDNQEQHMDQALRTAYLKTALHRMGIPFERAILLDAVRIPLEGSVRRSQQQPSTTPAQAAAGR
ncbi:MAG: hypothetical protein M0Q15_15710 [Nevskia sp.]|nr:hypothetical protein [Nevskia sp.]